jgi:cytochrome c553
MKQDVLSLTWRRGGLLTCLMTTAGLALSSAGQSAPNGAPAWVYPRGDRSVFGTPLGPGPFHVPGSALVLTRDQFDRARKPIDWHPADHPVAPASVSGPVDGSEPCAECHLFNGAGFPGAASLAGLPADYIVEQVTAFRTGERVSADAGQPDTAEMIKVAKSVPPEALRQAADYYAHLPRPRWLRVVESATAPRTVPDRFGWLDPALEGGTELVGDRIIELSQDWPRLMIYDDHVMLVDYVPPGAIARGKHLAETGGGAGVPCRSCHGVDLAGARAVPGIAGRPAASIARALWDMRLGARRNVAAAPMLAVAAKLQPAQIRDLSAYLASQH